jgi:hypothetical protein
VITKNPMQLRVRNEIKWTILAQKFCCQTRRRKETYPGWYGDSAAMEGGVPMRLDGASIGKTTQSDSKIASENV